MSEQQPAKASRVPVQSPSVPADPMWPEKRQAGGRTPQTLGLGERDLTEMFVKASLAASHTVPTVNDVVYLEVERNFGRGAVVDGKGRPSAISPNRARVDFTIENEARVEVLSQLATDGKICFRPNKPGTYTVFAQFHEGPRATDNQYSVMPYRFTVYKDENHYRTTLMEQFSRPVPFTDLQKSLEPWHLPTTIVSALTTEEAKPVQPSLSREQQTRLDFIAAKLVPQFEVQTSVPVPSMVELSKDAAPIHVSLGKRHDYRLDSTAHNASYHWYAIVQNSGHKHAHKLGKEFGQFAGLHAIDLREAARQDPRNHGSALDAITRPEMSIPVRFDRPDTYRIICIEYENGQPQRGPAWIGDRSNNWLYGVTEHAPVTVLDSKSYAVAQAAPARLRKRLEEAKTHQQTYRERVTELRGEFEGEPTPLQAIHIEKRSGAITPLFMFFGVQKGETSRYVLVDLTRHFDDKGGENPQVHRVYKGSPHVAIQELANGSEYPEGIIQISLPNLQGQRVASFSTFSISTHGAPWPERLGASLLSGWPVSLGVVGGSYGVSLLAARGAVTAATAAAAGTALSAIALPVMAAGVVGLGLYTASHATTDVVNPVAVGLDVVNLAACLLGGTALVASLPRVAMNLEMQVAERAMATDAAGRPPVASLAARAAGAAQGRELVFWANAANVSAIAADSGVLIAPEILHQIQIISQSGMPEPEKQEAVQGLIRSALSLGLLVLVGPKQDYAEARAILTKRVEWVRSAAKTAKAKVWQEREEFPRGIPAMGGTSQHFDDSFNAAQDVTRIEAILNEFPENLTVGRLTELVDRYSSAASATEKALERGGNSALFSDWEARQKKLQDAIFPAIGGRFGEFITQLVNNEPHRLDDIAKTIAALNKFSQRPESGPYRDQPIASWLGVLEQLQRETRLLQTDPLAKVEIEQVRDSLKRIDELLKLPLAEFSSVHFAEIGKRFFSALDTVSAALEHEGPSSLTLNWQLVQRDYSARQFALGERTEQFLRATLKNDRGGTFEISKTIEILESFSHPGVAHWIEALKKVEGHEFLSAIRGGGSSSKIPSLFRELRVFVQLSDSQLNSVAKKIESMNLNQKESSVLEAIFAKLSPTSNVEQLELAIEEYSALRKMEILIEKDPRDLSLQELVELRKEFENRQAAISVKKLKQGIEERFGIPVSNIHVVGLGDRHHLFEQKEWEVVLRLNEKLPEFLLAALSRANAGSAEPWELQATMGVAQSIPRGSYGELRKAVEREMNKLGKVFDQTGYVAESVNDGMVSFAGHWPDASSSDAIREFCVAKTKDSAHQLRIESFPTSKTIELSDGKTYSLTDVRIFIPGW